jgi:hypothetical protein
MKNQLVAALAVMVAVTAFSVNQPAQALKLWPFHKKAPAKVEAPAKPAVVAPVSTSAKTVAPVAKPCATTAKPCPCAKPAPAPAAKAPVKK